MVAVPNSAGPLIVNAANQADTFSMSAAAAAWGRNSEMEGESGTADGPDDLDVMSNVLDVSDCLAKDDYAKGEEEEFAASGQKWLVSNPAAQSGEPKPTTKSTKGTTQRGTSLTLQMKAMVIPRVTKKRPLAFLRLINPLPLPPWPPSSLWSP